MKSQRVWNRRENYITPNGFFNVLRSSGWFPAWRLPGGYRYLVDKSKEPSAPGRTSLDHAAGQESGVDLQILKPIEQRSSLLRMALIVVAAAAITAALLKWII